MFTTSALNAKEVKDPFFFFPTASYIPKFSCLLAIQNKNFLNFTLYCWE